MITGIGPAQGTTLVLVIFFCAVQGPAQFVRHCDCNSSSTALYTSLIDVLVWGKVSVVELVREFFYDIFLVTKILGFF